MRLLGILLIVILAVVAGMASASASASANVAPCDMAVRGTGPVDWRERSWRAGPVGVFERPLARMQRTKRGLVAKMPLLVEGQEAVTVSVPPGLRGRVFLYYGEMRDRHGEPSTSFANTAGYEETRFEPCPGRARTPWPGGIRIRGGKAVRLRVRTDAGAVFVLRLGRPQVYSPSARAANPPS